MVREIWRREGRREAVGRGREEGSGGQGKERENGQQAVSGLRLCPSLAECPSELRSSEWSRESPENWAWSDPGQAHEARITF